MTRCRSSFGGSIAEIPEIYVDNFSDTKKKAYFLSHCHVDHTDGLYRRSLLKDMKISEAKIYMTEESMKIVRHTAMEENIHNICDYIHVLELGTTTVTIGEDLHVEVTLIPAGHCLGSVMFLFRLNNKTILYTGDFRISTNDISKYKQFHKNGKPITIDAMYVDTTFLNIDYPEFAKRSTSVQEMIEKISSWLAKDPVNRVAIHTSAKFGYESVFTEIYQSLGMKVCVKENIWSLYQQFPKILQVLTVNESDPKIHLCESIRHLHKCYHKSLEKNNYLSVQFSAMSWKDYDEEQMAVRDGKVGIQVCFATHCSRTELISFVNYFQPTRVVGFRDPYKVESSNKVFHDEFKPSPKKKNLF